MKISVLLFAKCDNHMHQNMSKNLHNTLQTNKKSLMLLITANNTARGLPKVQAFEPYQKRKPKWEVND